jgi:hypothetical protein
MPANETALDLLTLERRPPLRTIRGRNSTKADILVYRHGTLQVALKDYRPRPWWVRLGIGRVLVSRETAAYEAARGIAGVARFLGRLGPLCLATEWVEGRPLREWAGEELPGGVFERLRGTLDRLHEAGIALGDVHHRDVLVDAAGRVTLVDLATAVPLGRRPGPMRSRLFRRLLLQDEISYARLKARFDGDDPEKAVAALGPAAAAAHARGRRLKRGIERLRGRRSAS